MISVSVTRAEVAAVKPNYPDNTDGYVAAKILRNKARDLVGGHRRGVFEGLCNIRVSGDAVVADVDIVRWA